LLRQGTYGQIHFTSASQTSAKSSFYFLILFVSIIC